MAEIQQPFPLPVQGADFAPGQPLPAPEQPEAIVVVTAPATKEEHKVQIFSSEDGHNGTDVKLYAQQLHTDVYREKGFISEADLTNGLFVDEYSNRSTYLYVENGSKVAASRYVRADKKQGGVMSLPTAKHFQIDSEKLREAAGVRRVADIKSNEIVEISGLVSRKQHGGQEHSLDATMALYARMLRDSLEQGHKVWLLNVEKKFLRYLNVALGKDQAHVLGPEKEYMGPATVPVAINPHEVVRSALTASGPGSDMRRAYLKEVLTGVDDRKIPKDIRELLKESDIPVTEYSPVKRVLLHPKTLAYTAIMAYSASRALPAATVDEFEGSTAMLWGIDVATAVPYTWGAIEAFTGKTATRKAVGAVVGAGSFVAPYAYFAAEGNNYPPAVNAIVAGFIGTAVLKESITHNVKNRKERALHEALMSVNPDNSPYTSGSSAHNGSKQFPFLKVRNTM